MTSEALKISHIHHLCVRKTSFLLLASHATKEEGRHCSSDGLLGLVPEQQDLFASRTFSAPGGSKLPELELPIFSSKDIKERPFHMVCPNNTGSGSEVCPRFKSSILHLLAE